MGAPTTVYGDKMGMTTRPPGSTPTSTGSAGSATGAAHRIGYGQHVVFGLYSLVTVYQGDLVVLYEIERGPIEEYVSIELGGVSMPVGGGTVSGITLEAPKKGEAAQVVSALLSTVFADHVERYPAHAYLVARFEADAVSAGSIPECRCIVKGRKDVYDPDSGTTGYTDTPALCTAHLVSIPEGGQLGSTGVVWPSVDAVADWHETLVSGSTRYAISALISESTLISQHVRAMLSQSSAWESWSVDGLWRMGCENAGAAAVATIAANWLYWQDGRRLPSEWRTLVDQQLTRLIVEFTDASRDYETGEVAAELAGVADGTQPLIQKRFPAPWITSKPVAARLAADLLDAAQASYRVQILCNSKALALEQGDVVATSGVFAVPDGTWTVLSSQPSIKEGIMVTLAQRPGNSVSAPASETKVTPPVPKPGDIPPAPTGLTLAVLESAAAGKVVYTIVASVDPPASVIVRSFLFQLYEGGGWRTVATADAAADRAVRFLAVGPGDNNVRVWAISHSGQWSATAASDTVTCGPGVGAYPAPVRGDKLHKVKFGAFASAPEIYPGGADPDPIGVGDFFLYTWALSDPPGLISHIEVETLNRKLTFVLDKSNTQVWIGAGATGEVGVPEIISPDEISEVYSLAHDGTKTPSTGTWNVLTTQYEGTLPDGVFADSSAPANGGLLLEAQYDSGKGNWFIRPVSIYPPNDGDSPVFDGPTSRWQLKKVGGNVRIPLYDSTTWVFDRIDSYILENKFEEFMGSQLMRLGIDLTEYSQIRVGVRWEYLPRGKYDIAWSSGSTKTRHAICYPYLLKHTGTTTLTRGNLDGSSTTTYTHGANITAIYGAGPYCLLFDASGNWYVIDPATMTSLGQLTGIPTSTNATACAVNYPYAVIGIVIADGTNPNKAYLVDVPAVSASSIGTLSTTGLDSFQAVSRDGQWIASYRNSANYLHRVAGFSAAVYSTLTVPTGISLSQRSANNVGWLDGSSLMLPGYVTASPYGARVVKGPYATHAVSLGYLEALVELFPFGPRALGLFALQADIVSAAARGQYALIHARGGDADIQHVGMVVPSTTERTLGLTVWDTRGLGIMVDQASGNELVILCEGASGQKVGLQYKTAAGAWSNFDGSGAGAVGAPSITDYQSGVALSAWQAVPAGAQAAVTVRPVFEGGDKATNVHLRELWIELKE